jgi:hypothetical protein
MLLLWNCPRNDTTALETIGPEYALRLNQSSWLEGHHAFTAFENRLGLKLNFLGDADNAGDYTWTAGSVVRIYHEKRKPRMGRKDPYSHTKRMAELYPDSPHLPHVTIWGPYLGTDNIKNALADSVPVVLVGSGSGVGYILDALQLAAASKPDTNGPRLTVIFTTRSKPLHEWVQCAVEQIVSGARFCNTDDGDESWDFRSRTSILLALTGVEASLVNDDVETQLSRLETKSKSSVARPVQGRVDFGKVIAPGSVVFCQGGAGVKASVSKACDENKSRFFGGRGGS